MIIILAIYILSAFLTWRYLHIAYSDNGRWSLVNPTAGDIVMVLFPIINTLASIILPILGTPYGDDVRSKWMDKFFNIKK